MRDGIDWAEVGAGGRFEQIVSVLLSTMYPDSQRIDGAGGDGGRDHQLFVDGRLEFWQSKYFLRRLADAGGRKAQIKKSLAVASALQPDSWTLLTPMVPTPEERKWFDGLQGDYPFPLDWKGGEWLDAQLAQHPAIVRYFMGPNDQYVALLRELDQEQDALVGGLPAAAGRIQQLAAKIDDSDPFYTVAFTVDDGKITGAGLRPKYVGAEIDSPIKVKFRLAVGPNPADKDLLERLRDAIEWGEEIELPASNVRDFVVDAPHGLGGAHASARIRLGPVEREQINLALRLIIASPDAKQLAALPAYLVSRTHGERGITLHGRDITGVVNARLRLDHELSTVSLSLTYEEELPLLLPGALLPVLRFMHHAVGPNLLSFIVGNSPSATPALLPPGDGTPPEQMAFVEGLDKVQAAASDAFPLPQEWTGADEREVRRAVRLLDGQRVRIGSGPLRFSMQDPEAYQQAASTSELHSLAIVAREPYAAAVCGHSLNLGPCTYYVQAARFETVVLPAGQQADHEIVVTPEPGFGVEVALGAMTHSPGRAPAPPA